MTQYISIVIQKEFIPPYAANSSEVNAFLWPSVLISVTVFGVRKLTLIMSNV